MKANVRTPIKNGATPLYVAAQNGRIKCLKFLAEAKADISRQYKTGATPVLIAVENGHLDCLKFLEKMKASLTTPNETGATPVLIAAGRGRLECLKFLARMNADLTMPDINGFPPAYYADMNINTSCLQFLADEGVNLTNERKPNQTRFLQNYIDAFSIGEEVFFKNNANKDYEIGYVGSLQPLKVYKKGWAFSYYCKYIKKKSHLDTSTAI